MGRCPWLAEIGLVGGTTHPKISNVYVGSESESVSGALQVAMDSPRIVYRAKHDVTPEGELNAVASVYRFILGCQSKQEAVEPASKVNGRDVAKESNEHDATENCCS